MIVRLLFLATIGANFDWSISVDEPRGETKYYMDLRK